MIESDGKWEGVVEWGGGSYVCVVRKAICRR